MLKFEKKLRDEVQIVTEAGATEPGLTKVISLADVLVSMIPMEIQSMNSPLQSRVRDRVMDASLRTMHGKMPAFYEAMYSENKDEGQH